MTTSQSHNQRMCGTCEKPKEKWKEGRTLYEFSIECVLQMLGKISNKHALCVAP